MILILRGQINYFREPLPQIFGKAGKKADSEAFELLGDAELRLREKDGEIARIWPEETDRIYGRLQVTAEDIEIFKYPGSFIGQTDYDNHIAHFDYLEEKLREQIREADSDFKTKSPMYSKIGFALGAMLAILFM